MKLSKTLVLGAAATLAVTLSMARDSKPAADTTTRVAGTVKGMFTFDGKKPEMKPLVISAAQSKGCCADGEDMDSVDRSLLLDDKGGIANVVVTLTVEGKKVELPEEPIKLDQSKCRFEPHIMVIPAGATVGFGNSDAVSHNIHTYAAKNDGTNKTVAPGGELKYKLAKAEAVKIACDIHPWMLGWIYVTDATHWAVSGADGSFAIEDVPPGEYKLTVWHEKLGKAKASVTVAADGTSELVQVKMGAKKKGGRRR